jgi:hypothetical protein
LVRAQSLALHGKASAATQHPNPARMPQQNDGFEDKIQGNSRVLMYEKLVRKVLNKPKHPALIMMQVVAVLCAFRWPVLLLSHLQPGLLATPCVPPLPRSATNTTFTTPADYARR